MATIRISIDKAAGAAYVQLSEAPIARTIEINDFCFVDVDEFDCVLGVELLSFDRIPLSEILSGAHVKSEDLEPLKQALNRIPQYTMTTSSLTAKSQITAAPQGTVPA